MQTTPVALVPARDPGRAKSRLAAALPDGLRAELAAAMLADVVAALRAGGVERVVVLAGGPAAARVATDAGAEVLLDDTDAGLDAVLASAARQLGATPSLVVPADVPTLLGDEVAALLAHTGDVVVAPTHDGGTGGLLRRVAWTPGTAYGPDSATRHLDAARGLGLDAQRLDLPGFALDVDVPDDLTAAAASPVLGPATRAVLDRVGVA